MELQTLYEEVRNYAAPIQLGKTRQTVAELCAEVWANLEEQRKHLDVRLEIDCGDCPAIYCDAQRVSQVIRNIYENALAVSPKGSTLFTTCKPVQHSQIQFVQVCFTDDGPGLSEEQRQRIFEPFFTTKTKGTGLGMAICQRLVEAHAGRIYVGEQEHRHPKAHGAVMVMELPI
jgi:signal transduction histidine kinase